MSRIAKGPQLEVARIQSEINRLFESLVRLREGGGEGGGWSPGVDVAESETHVVVDIELPGVGPESVTLVAEGGELVVRGERRAPRRPEAAEIVHDEREYGPFERRIPIPAAVNPREARAWLADGVLRAELPKVPNRRGRAVPIRIETDPAGGRG
ncbi:MAG: Hsp20/alpha crystallin family protein [Acidobacteria bacterium]|nr:MAG: Hsp20/alpha crystallin family protein [Acidobacteriota bacterium]